MSYRILFPAVLSLLLLLPATLRAGGPPWLCLPIDGVTSENVQACGAKLTTALDDKRWKYGDDWAVQIRAHEKQWYLTFPMGKDVALSEVEAALKGSRFAIPRDSLRLFGHVILEVDRDKLPAKELLADLEALEYVSVSESHSKGTSLQVTVDMPYPAGERSPDRGAVGWRTFKRNDFASDAATRSESAAKAAELPSFGDFRDVAAKHGANLKDIRWSTDYACRTLGGVAVEDSGAAAATTTASRSAD